jgi:hypothetical protein
MMVRPGVRCGCSGGVALAVMASCFREAVRVAASGRKRIAMVAMPKTHTCAMSYSH